jgi:hypothetical protein
VRGGKRQPRGGGCLLFVGLLLTPFVAAVEAEFVAAERPRLEKLFGSLDPAVEALAPALEAWRAGDLQGASAALVAYYRERPSRLPGLTPALTLRADTRHRADEFLAGRYDPVGQRVPLERRPDGGIDWQQRGPRGDKEFAWMLNRQHFLTDLLESHRETGDPAYAAAVDTVIADWVRQNPYPDRLTFSAPWRALEVARRMLDAWGAYFDALRAPGVLRDETLLLLLGSVPEHADALHDHASSWGGNHLVTEKVALVLLALQWPEFRDAARWRADGEAVTTREILAQTCPDGVHAELSNHYHRVMLQNAQHFAGLFRLAGESPPAAFAERLEAMWHYFLAVARPSGWGPLNNAGDAEHNWLLAETLGPEATTLLDDVRARTLHLFPWAGQVILREDWTPGADWAFFDVGPHGTAHQHDDALHLSIDLAGEPFLVDAGRYTYQPGPWRDYFTGPRAHNVPTIAGFTRRTPPFRRVSPLDPVVLASPELVAAAGEQWFDAREPTDGRTWRHRRMLLQPAGGGFVVVDQLTGFGPLDLTFRWHFAPERGRAEIREAFAFEAAQPPEEIWVRGSPNPVAGWRSRQYGEKEEAWQYEARWRAHGPQVVVWKVGAAALSEVRREGRGLHLDFASGSYLLDLPTFALRAAAEENGR